MSGEQKLRRDVGGSSRSRLVSAGVVAVALAFAVVAAPAQASVFNFTGSQGTTCSVDVNAVATNGINGLQLPHVGFAAEPKCRYVLPSPNPSPGAGTPASALSGVQAKACKKKKKGAKGKAKKRCKRSPRRGGERQARGRDLTKGAPESGQPGSAGPGCSAAGPPARPLPAG